MSFCKYCNQVWAEPQQDATHICLEGRIAALEAELAEANERSAGLAAVITREHGPQYVTEFDCAAILSRVREKARREGAVEALEAINLWSVDTYGDDATCHTEIRAEIRCRIAALEGGKE